MSTHMLAGRQAGRQAGRFDSQGIVACQEDMLKYMPWARVVPCCSAKASWDKSYPPHIPRRWG